MPNAKLDWKSGHDPRSKNFRFYGIADPKELAQKIRAKFWEHGIILNQGSEGACVGYGWTAELVASPKPYEEGIVGETTAFAKRLYQKAREQDRKMGWNFSEGASVLGGAKAVNQLGFVGEYRWAMSIEELRDAVINEGPVVIGIPWLDGMYETRPSSLVEVNGRVVGGHCLTIIGYHPSMRIIGEDWKARFEVFRWVNSWGLEYGKEGTGLIKIDDLERLLQQQGEACIPMHRNTISKLS